VNKRTEPTVNISQMTDGQVQALLSGSMTWEDAVAIAPGPPLTIIEVTTEEVEAGALALLEDDDGKE
jgi:hypothetical protein